MENDILRPMNHKRKSRFDDEHEEEPATKKPNVDLSIAALKAAEISKELSSKIALLSSMKSEMNANNNPAKKPIYHTLKLDEQGREIDEFGNIVKADVQQIKTLAANVAVINAQKKKENPYLSHRATIASQITTEIETVEVQDERLPNKSRANKNKKSLQFVEPGKFIQEENNLKEKEERKLMAGYTSGRKTIQNANLVNKDEDAMSVHAIGEDKSAKTLPDSVPSLSDIVVPALEWWDEAFLPKQRREQRKMSKAACEEDDFSLLFISNSKTHKFIQHPPAVKTLCVEPQPKPLPMFLTKKERKKLRKSTRQVREQEKRDKQMLGLIPAPEPKFKLSNFMKILGDQAVADPSKVELRVLQQMQKRVLNHEMRNLAAKLTPKERKEKKMKKLQEDVSKGIYAAVFRVTDFSSLKNRFKVDVNAQQLFLAGLVLLVNRDYQLENGIGDLVVVEGGPKSIRKFIRLMTERIDWTLVNDVVDAVDIRRTDALGHEMRPSELGQFNYQGESKREDNDGGEDSDSDDEEEVQEIEETKGESHNGGSTIQPKRPSVRQGEKRCDLLWTGVLPRKVFQGFKYQEAKTPAAARKLLESKGVAHYWDMLVHADDLIQSVLVDH